MNRTRTARTSVALYVFIQQKATDVRPDYLQADLLLTSVTRKRLLVFVIRIKEYSSGHFILLVRPS